MTPRILTSAFLALVLAAACSPSPAGAGKLRAVATFSILGDWVKNVGGEKVSVYTLVGPDGDAHTFEPSPRDGVAMVRAALIFENGLGLEPWLEALYKSTRSKARRVVVTQGLEPLYVDEGHNGRKEADPHMWHDAARAAHMVRAIRDALIRTDPANAGVFRANAKRYTAEIRALDGWILRRVQTVPKARRLLVTSHNTLGYFAARYDFEVRGSALNSLTTEAFAPPASRISALIKEIRSSGVPAVFPENIHSPKLMERLAAETGAKVAPGLYTGALGERGGPAGTYVKMMRYNVRTIVRAFRP